MQNNHKHISIVRVGILATFLVWQDAAAQPISFEKQGRFIPSDPGLSMSTLHMKGEVYEGPQPFDVLHYRLMLDLSLVNEGLSGISYITMRVKTALDSLVLHAVGLRLDSVKVDGAVQAVTADSVRETFTIHLNTPRNPGDTLQIETRYERIIGYPRPSSRRGYYFFKDSIGLPSNLGYTFSEPSDARFWFPCYDEPWDKASLEMVVTVPDGYIAASNGRLASTTSNGNGTTTWYWRENHQIATYLICLTISRFSISQLPFISSSGDTIALQYYTWNSSPFIDSASAASYLPTVRQMMAAYEGYFGTYPFDKYGMTSIVPFTYAGMEHQTITTMNRYLQTNERVVSHELVHQWWGDLITCGTWADIWLNEGFATYGEALWKEYQGGRDSLVAYMKKLEEFQFASWSGAVYNPVGQGSNLFSPVVYTKAAWVLHTLRGVVGDSPFFQILQAYRSVYAGKSAITDELAGIVDSVTGMDMAWFFTQWIYGSGWPKYAHSWLWTPDTLSVTIYQRQSTSWPTYTMPIQVKAYRQGNDTTFVVWDSLRTQVFSFDLSWQPDSVAIDPDRWILKQLVDPPVSVDNEGVVHRFVLYQNFPNPFNGSTIIPYRLETAERVTLTIFNLLGEEVTVLDQGRRGEGTHQVFFDAAALPSGVYFYRINAGAKVASGKMILMR
jgi:aminopeptidase N